MGGVLTSTNLTGVVEDDLGVEGSGLLGGVVLGDLRYSLGVKGAPGFECWTKGHIFSSVVLPSAEGYSRLWANLVSSYLAVISTNRIHYSTMTLGDSLSSDPASTPASPGQGSLSSLPNTPLPSDISHPSVSIQSVKESSWGDVAVLDKTSNNYAAWS
ncbi:hypothetical protein K443DRAFT_949 [Laccaria amethystina LaAM-08-1]|uniref:Uncharacterized protein n=1 Tax=Laccaria amethystina LaAM-08-1 TaxID=1095629 RepID=A0A0C9XW66_9AGAR|nr:hypothetical protein K443DRAFT_949 [Laccaria amethystina LaAM-08-1]